MRTSRPASAYLRRGQLVHAGVLLGIEVIPGRLRGARDQPVAVGHLLPDLAEVLQLEPVDVGVELDVEAEQPPAMRQPEGEVGSELLAVPSAHRLGLPEHPQERRESVVPVVVARDRVRDRSWIAAIGQCRRRIDVGGASLVVADVAGRVDLVAAHHQDRSASEHVAVAAVEVGQVAGQQARHRVRRVEAVADVADVVQPVRLVDGGAAGVVEVLPLVEARTLLDLALVDVLTEQRAEQHLDSGAAELGRRQPSDGGCRIERAGAGSRSRRLGRGRGGIGRIHAPYLLGSRPAASRVWLKDA